MEIHGTSALVTGASRGIGRAVAVALAKQGVRVGLVARGKTELEALATITGGWALPCDVTDTKSVERMIARFREAAGAAPDLVVGCAGTFSLHPIEETGTDVLLRHLSVNLVGRALVVGAVLPFMKERKSGTLIQVGSVAGRKAFPMNAAYSSSKYGLRGYHEVLLEELRGTGVRATLLEPAATDTSLWDPIDPDRHPDLPVRTEMLRPEEVADAVIFVATRPRRVRIPYLPIERG